MAGGKGRSPAVEQPWAERQTFITGAAALRTPQFLEPPGDLERRQHTF